jgi:hypothetical protein
MIATGREVEGKNVSDRLVLGTGSLQNQMSRSDMKISPSAIRQALIRHISHKRMTELQSIVTVVIEK